MTMQITLQITLQITMQITMQITLVHGRWCAWQDDVAAGAALPIRFPDGRLRLYFDGCRPNAYAELAGAVAAVPAGMAIVSAAEVEFEPLMLLDCALRQDIPGGDGWQPDPDGFREQIYGSDTYDPLTYHVALDGDDCVGLARVWVGPQPRLGCVGTLGQAIELRRPA